jgi:hypothetical protein
MITRRSSLAEVTLDGRGVVAPTPEIRVGVNRAENEVAAYFFVFAGVLFVVFVSSVASTDAVVSVNFLQSEGSTGFPASAIDITL